MASTKEYSESFFVRPFFLCSFQVIDIFYLENVYFFFFFFIVSCSEYAQSTESPFSILSRVIHHVKDDDRR